MSKLTKSVAWSRLHELSKKIPQLAQLFKHDSARSERYSVAVAGLTLDYSKNLIDDKILGALFALAEQGMLDTYKHDLFSGKPINLSENRPALHTALRACHDGDLTIDGVNVSDAVAGSLSKIYAFAHKLRTDKYRICPDRPIEAVVNIGVGGSELGPRMAVKALAEFAQARPSLHFVAHVDESCIQETLKKLDPRSTLCIVQSKSFNTQETLLNAGLAMDWYLEANIDPSLSMVAITANTGRAREFGICADHIFEFWDWVGGRYSLWGPVGLPLVIAIGEKHFGEFLRGAMTMDAHFRDAPAEHNMPVLLALIGIWHHNFLNAHSHAIVPYCERLSVLPSYIQQLDMESNGKSVDKNGMPLDYQTAPIVWGQCGTNAQHSFFQLLHQGTRLVPVDFIATRTNPEDRHHRVLLMNMLAQAAVLMGYANDKLPAHQQGVANRPSNILLLDKLNPYCLGALIALYEHKVFVQGAIWGINSFDQWGVEGGKNLTRALLHSPKEALHGLDQSSIRLLQALNLDNGRAREGNS